MLGMHLPTHLGVELAAAHRRDLEAVSRRRRRATATKKRIGASLLTLRSARHRRRALRAA
jgi:hypothetical protein